MLPTSSRWETWARDSVLDLVRQFIHEVEEEDEKSRKTGNRFLIFPRYQQLDCVRRLVADARGRGTGQRYLVQHSAGSGKSFTIAWLAHQLSTLHDAGDRRVFDSIVVVTDRRVLDRQLQTTMRQFEQTLGVVENVDKTSRQLKEALGSGKTIIVTTLQKFPVMAKEIGELPGKRFAVIVDEAHSSQSGESTKSLKAVKGIEANPDGDFFVRSGPGTVKLPPESAREYVRTRFRTRVVAPGVGDPAEEAFSSSDGQARPDRDESDEGRPTERSVEPAKRSDWKTEKLPSEPR
jgi:hypothetical protein